MAACSGEQKGPVVATPLPRPIPAATLAPTPTYTADQVEKRRLGKELEDMDLFSFRGILLNPNSPIAFGDIVFANLSQSNQVILDPNGLRYWLDRCGVNNLANYRLAIAIQDVNPGPTLMIAQARDEGQVAVDITQLSKIIQAGFDTNVIVSPQNRASALDHAFQTTLNLTLAQGICGVAKGSEVARSGTGVPGDEGNKKADEIGKLGEDFTTGKLPLIAAVKSPPSD